MAVVTAQVVLHVSVHIGWVGGGESEVDTFFFLSIFWLSIDNGK